MQFRLHWLLLSLVFIQMAAVDSAAAVVALRADDSVGGLTADTPLLSDNPVNGQPSPGGNDDEWGFAANPSNGQSQLGNGSPETTNLFNYVWVSRADLGEDAPQLTTTIGGLNVGDIYNIYLYQVTHDRLPFGLQAAISGSTLTTYQLGDGDELDGSSELNLERVLLGQVNGLTSVDVITDDVSDRGFLKGFGVQLIPEPTGLFLVMMTMMALCFHRQPTRTRFLRWPDQPQDHGGSDRRDLPSDHLDQRRWRRPPEQQRPAHDRHRPTLRRHIHPFFRCHPRQS